MARGGRRSGKPGANYSNRSDLQNAPRLAPTAQTGQPYGTAGQQLDAQSVLPMAPPPISLSAPTTRPNEPVTSGLPTGPGPGPEVLSNAQSPDPTIAELRALYALYPNRELAEILEDIDSGITF
jgi:hypothetical protein